MHRAPSGINTPLGDAQARGVIGGDCQTVRLTASDAAPFGLVAVDGWKLPLEEEAFLLARIAAAGAEPTVVVVCDHTDTVWLPVPLHPGDPAGGGPAAEARDRTGTPPPQDPSPAPAVPPEPARFLTDLVSRSASPAAGPGGPSRSPRSAPGGRG